jgi:hypothetical protein
MSNLTEKEEQVLNAILSSNYQSEEGIGVVNNPIWSFSIEEKCSLKGKEISGVCSSLSKKGYVTNGYSDGDDTISITLDGWNVLNRLDIK